MSGPESRPGRRRATALKYDREAGAAPRVVATGAGVIAERIVELALQQGVPVREEPALVEALARLELEQEIPPELFVAVAEVLVWAYGLERPAVSRPPEERP
jgi:flagellar biosynthesis protein